MAVGPRAIRRIHGIHVTIEQARSCVDILWIRRIRWRQLGGNREVSTLQYLLQTPTGAISGQARLWLRFRASASVAIFDMAGHGLLSLCAACCSAVWRATRSHEDVPFKRWSTGNCTT